MKHQDGYRDITDHEFEVEIPAGKEFDLYTHSGWVTGKYPDILDKNPELNEFGSDNMMKLAHARTRVKIEKHNSTENGELEFDESWLNRLDKIVQPKEKTENDI